MPDFVFCPRVSPDGWVAHPVTGDPYHRKPPVEHYTACASCGATIACSPENDPDLVPICGRHLDEPWPPTIRPAA